MEFSMKVFKFLTLMVSSISVSVALANNEDLENKKIGHIRSAPTSIDPLFRASVQAAKDKITTRNVMDTKNPSHIILAKNVLKANYIDLEKSQLKAQRKQRIAERRERIEVAKRIKMINNHPANDIDTLNVVNYMNFMFFLPKAKNPDLEEAIALKMKDLAKGQRFNSLQDQIEKLQEKETFIQKKELHLRSEKKEKELALFLTQKEIVLSLIKKEKSRLEKEINFLSREEKQGPQPRIYAEDQARKSTHTDELEHTFLIVGQLHKKFEVKHGQRQVSQKPAPLHVKEIFKTRKPQIRAFAKKNKVWGKIREEAAAAAAA